MPGDYYDVLGVAPDADLELIKQRYRVLVRQNHPDVVADKQAAHLAMQSILQAWNTLKDPEARERYDRSRPQPALTAPARPARQGPRAGAAPRASNERVRLATMVFEANVFFYDMKQPAEAVELARKVLKADRNNADAASLLGDIFKQQGDLRQARSMYDSAVRMQPESLIYRQKLETLDKLAPVGSTSSAGASAAPASNDETSATPSAKGCGAAALFCFALASAELALFFRR